MMYSVTVLTIARCINLACINITDIIGNTVLNREEKNYLVLLPVMIEVPALQI